MTWHKCCVFVHCAWMAFRNDNVDGVTQNMKKKIKKKIRMSIFNVKDDK